MNSATLIPAAKVSAATIGAAVGTIVAWLIGVWLHRDVPVAVDLALQTLFVAAFTFLFGYLTPPASRDVIVPKP